MDSLNICNKVMNIVLVCFTIQEVIMKLIYIIALCCFNITAYAQSRIDFSLSIDGKKRDVIIVKPSGDVPSGGYPVVCMFHGTGGGGERTFGTSQWKEKGEKEKFITVFPSSLEYCIIENGKQENTTKWHISQLDSVACPGQTLADDVKFVRTFLDTIIQSFPINKRRIYATGFSNGASFVSKLAVEMNDVFAAVAPSGGGLNRGDSNFVTHRIPIWLVLGSKDNKWLDNFAQFGLKEFPLNDSTLLWLRAALGRYRGLLGLDTIYTKNSMPKVLTYIYNTPLNKAEAASEFRFTLVDGMTHEYPNGENSQYVLADILWDNFFSKISKNTITGLYDSDQTQITVYPQPAESFVTIEGLSQGWVEIYDIMGNKLITQQMNGKTIVDVSLLVKGYYTLTLNDGITYSITDFIKM